MNDESQVPRELSVCQPGGGRQRRRERGQALVEFALVVPIFLILIFGIIDFGMGLKAWISITNSAREGARLGALSPGCNAIKQKAVDTSPGLVPALTTSNVSVLITGTPLPDCKGSSGDKVAVTVAYTYNYITPLGHFVQGLAGALHMSSTSSMRLE